MIRIAIVEDNPKDRALTREYLDCVFEQESASYSADDFEKAETFLLKANPVYDIVLFDIDMPGMSGLEAAKKFREIDRHAVIMFVTNMAQYAIHGYEVEALDFIVKPVNKYDFIMKMRRAISRTAKRLDDAVEIKIGRDIRSVGISQIRYLEVSGHYVVWHTVGGDYVEYDTLINAEKKIARSFFARCNRCYLVNLKYVEQIKRDSVVVDGVELSISRPQKKEFLAAYSRFIGGGGDKCFH